MAKISVIIPVYNTQDYLSDCLQSVLGQTHSDLEVICIDDASTDDSLKVIENLSRRDMRVRVVTFSGNRGQGCARNEGIRLASGDYIGFVDSDDVVDPRFFEDLLLLAETKNAEIAAGHIQYDEDGLLRVGDWPRYEPILESVVEDLGAKIKTVYVNCNTSACKHLFKKDFLDSNQISFLNGLYHEDQFFMMKAYVMAKRVAFDIDGRATYKYRVRSGSSMHQDVSSQKYLKMLTDQVRVFEEILSFFLSMGFSGEQVKGFEEIVRRVLKDTCRRIDLGVFPEYFQSAKKLNLSRKDRASLRWIFVRRSLRIDGNLSEVRFLVHKIISVFRGRIRDVV